MAASSDIETVRRQTGVSDTGEPYTDAFIATLIDASGVTGATVTIWKELRAKYATLVDVTEAGASHKFSDLFKHATEQLGYYEEVLLLEVGPDTVRVKKVVRS